jgi:carboxyl-terminal processing protease
MPLSLKVFGALCATLLGLAILIRPAAAEPRVALVIGNSAYKGDLPALPNPANDARLMAETLKSVGFDVVEAEDADQLSMKKAIQAFGNKLMAAGSQATGLFFYAGHGVQVGGENYLIPVDAQIQKEADVDLAAVSAGSVLKQMDFAGSAVNIVILDACRNNPLAANSRGMTRGLAEMQSKPRGSFIAYSTAPGSTAADGDSANSPYTKALAETIKEPGLSISDVFQEVRTKVLAATGNQQTPWDSSSLTGRFFFIPPTDAQVASVTPPPQPGQQPTTPSTGSAAEDSKLALDVEWWKSVKDSSDPAEIQLYLDKFPDGSFASDAKAKLAQLKAAQTQTASAAPAQSAVGAIDHSSAGPEPAAPALAPAPAMVAMIALDQTVYAKGDGRVRAAPDAKAALITALPRNAEISATGRTTDGKWWRIAMPNGQVGYMHTTVVSEQPFQTASAPQPEQGQYAAQPPQTRGADALEPAPAQVQSAPSSTDQFMQGLASAAAQQFGINIPQQPMQQNPQTVSYTLNPMNHVVQVRAGAMIFNAVGGQPIYTLRQGGPLLATARGSDGRWYQVSLPNGGQGYVPSQSVTP